MKYLLKYFNIEGIIFYSLVFVGLYPIFGQKYFTTLDGGAHLYNSNIINAFISGNATLYEEIFSINTELVPNWIGHFVIAVLLFFTKSYIAEKIVISITLVLTSIFFRKLILRINQKNSYLSFLCLPFTHYYLLYLGFYNFTIGILFFLLLLLFWLSNKEKNSYKSPVIAVLLLLIYFSHLFVLIIALIYLFIDICVEILTEYKKTNPLNIIKKYSPIVIASIPSIILTLLYFKNRIGNNSIEKIYLSSKEICIMILNGDLFKVFSDDESILAKTFTVIILLLYLFSTTFYYIRQKKKNIKNKKQNNVIITFNIIVVCIFLMLFILPNDDGYGGYITIRLIYFFLIFLIFSTVLLLSSNNFFKIIFIITISIGQYKNIELKQNGQMWLNTEKKDFEKVSTLIPNNSRLFTYLTSKNDNWLGGHFVESLGADNRILVLNNYEASKGYFPVSYKKREFPKYFMGNELLFYDLVQKYGNINDSTHINVNYILVYGDTQNVGDYYTFIEKIKGNYTQIFSTHKVNLFELNEILKN